jgi:hypothetical protein
MTTRATQSKKKLEAALELKTRRDARNRLIDFTKFIRPAYQATWFHPSSRITSRC